MKIRTTILKHLIVLCSAFATMAAFGQFTYTWTGAANGTNLNTAGNYDTNGVVATTLPNGHGNDGITAGDTIAWDNVTTSNLVLSLTAAIAFPNSGFGSDGLQLTLTPNQTNSVQIICPILGTAGGNGGSTGFGVNTVTNNSASTPLILGDNVINVNGFYNFVNFAGRPAGATHYWVNNSTAPVTINGSVRWVAGGGTAYTLDFSGPGNWIANNYLRNDNGSGGTTITVEGPGTMTWTANGYLGRDAINAVNINGGTLIIGGSGLLEGQITPPIIANLATLIVDAPSQTNNFQGTIGGTGLLQVNNGMLKLTGENVYTGNTILNGGEVVVNNTENVGGSGPLGVGGTISFAGGTLGFTVYDVFDYSPRFSTAAGQQYSIDTGGQSVLFTNGLTSSGGTLAKVGSGTLTLGGANTYSGNTTISSGKLVFQGSMTGAGSITVPDGTTLGVTGTNTPLAPGTLTLGTSAGATLEFNNVNSTATALIAAGTLASVGTIIINVNSGTLTPGHSYPLLTWTSGPAPTVTLGVLNGFIGNLSFSGNKLLLNITATAYKWSGANGSSWDLITPNNWIQNGGPVTFANGGPALFDDTATGGTGVIISGVVQPTSVTVNSSTLSYTIFSSTGNDIGGSASLAKNGTSTLTLSGGGNTYTGVTTVSGGIVSVSTLANGGSASDIGAAANSAANLVLNGGTLQYLGLAASIDRLFTLTTFGGTIDASGSGALNLDNSSALGYSGNGPRTLTLTGNLSDTNTLAAVLADNGGATSLAKGSAGTWVLTGNNTYSGGTTIASGGTLQVGAAGPGGSLGTGAVDDAGTLIFDVTNTLTVPGAISGGGPVTTEGSGTVILSGNNSYSGGTTISAGTLQVGSGGASGTLNANGAVVDNGTLIFNSTGVFVLNSVISGTGQLVKKGSGLLKLLGANTFTGGTTIASGGVLQICQGNQGAFASPVITNNGSLIFVRQDNAVFIYAGNIIGSGSVTEDVNNDNSGDSTLTGTNGYTGGTTIKGGGLILGDGVNPINGTIVGNVVFTNSSVSTVVTRTLTFNRPDNFTFSNNIVGAVTGIAAANSGSVVQEGTNTLTLTGTNTYPGGTTITSGTLQVGAGGTQGTIGSGAITDNSALVFDRSDNVTLSNAISGTGTVVQDGPGTITLTASNTYTGATMVSNGTLVLNYAGNGGTNAVGGDMDVSGGTLAVGGVGAISTLNVAGNMNIASGTVVANLHKGLAQSNSLFSVTSTITATGGTLRLLNFGPSVAIGDQFTIFSQAVSGGATMTIESPGFTVVNNLAVNGSVTVSALAPGQLTATRSGGQLNLSWPASLMGLHLQMQTNSLKVGLSNNWVDIVGTEASNSYSATLGTNGCVFFRMGPQ